MTRCMFTAICFINVEVKWYINYNIIVITRGYHFFMKPWFVVILIFVKI